jgi:hypothetical protein
MSIDGKYIELEDRDNTMLLAQNFSQIIKLRRIASGEQ